jgi:hypothetical protein
VVRLAGSQATEQPAQGTRSGGSQGRRCRRWAAASDLPPRERVPAARASGLRATCAWPGLPLSDDFTGEGHGSSFRWSAMGGLLIRRLAAMGNDGGRKQQDVDLEPRPCPAGSAISRKWSKRLRPQVPRAAWNPSMMSAQGPHLYDQDHNRPQVSLSTPPGLWPTGLRSTGRSAELAVWAGDTKQWQDSGGVTGVAAQRCGDVAPAVETQDADGHVAQAGHGARRGTGADPRGQSGDFGLRAPGASAVFRPADVPAVLRNATHGIIWTVSRSFGRRLQQWL